MIRIHIDGELKIGSNAPLSDAQKHYLNGVMRLKPGDKFVVFGGGKEFLAEMPGTIISETGRADTANGATLAFCPVKPARMEEMISMATQIGVAKFQPVISKFTDIPKMNFQRFRKIAIEASEQCGRISIPEFLPAKKFAEFVSGAENLFYGDERPPTENRKAIFDSPARGEFILLIGPEGGFAPEEFAMLEKSGARGISLGPTILRAETAAALGLAKLLLI